MYKVYINMYIYLYMYFIYRHLYVCVCIYMETYYEELVYVILEAEKSYELSCTS